MLLLAEHPGVEVVEKILQVLFGVLLLAVRVSLNLFILLLCLLLLQLG